MTYELAKKLKEAGFPQIHRESDCHRNDCYEPEMCESIPTLSELIEACIGPFKKTKEETVMVLETDYRINYVIPGDESELGEYRWRTRIRTGKNPHECSCLYCDADEDEDYARAYGYTAEEAVAHLYLELHKNG